MLPLPRFSIGQKVLPAPGSTLYDVFPDEPGEIIERRYSVEKRYWMYMVRFPFDVSPFPQDTLREAKPEEEVA